MDSEKGGGGPRSITLYVTGVARARLDQPRDDGVVGVDTEFSREGAGEMIKFLTDRMVRDDPGAIRVRLLGRVVVG